MIAIRQLARRWEAPGTGVLCCVLTVGSLALTSCDVVLRSNVFRCDANGRCPKVFECAPVGTLEEGFCVTGGSFTWVDAGPADAGPADAGPAGAKTADASPIQEGGLDAARDAEAGDAHLSGPDAVEDASDDAAPGPRDAELDSALDSNVPDALVSDASPSTAADTSVPPEPPAPTVSPCVTWVPTTERGIIPSGAISYAMEQNAQAKPRGADPSAQPPYFHSQYLCSRDRVTPGKWIPDYSCSSAVFSSGNWSPVYASGESPFEVMVPASGCQLAFVPLGTNALSANAVVVGIESPGKPVYACRAYWEEGAKKGDHLGRLDTTRDPLVCRFEYYGGRVLDNPVFDLLVQQ